MVLHARSQVIAVRTVNLPSAEFEKFSSDGMGGLRDDGKCRRSERSLNFSYERCCGQEKGLNERGESNKYRGDWRGRDDELVECSGDRGVPVAKSAVAVKFRERFNATSTRGRTKGRESCFIRCRQCG